MKTATQIRREVKQLYRLCLVNGLLDEGRVRQVVTQVIDSRHRGYLSLLSRFQRLVRLDREAHTAKIETAVSLPSEMLASVQARIAVVYGSGIDVQFAVKPALIGGMRIRVGSDVYDGSVQSELAALDKSFSTTGANGRDT
jgi:F-type H+-transporting ATPase subunit delta